MNQGPTCSYVKFLRGVLNTKHVIEMQNYFFCFVVFFFLNPSVWGHCILVLHLPLVWYFGNWAPIPKAGSALNTLRV